MPFLDFLRPLARRTRRWIRIVRGQDVSSRVQWKCDRVRLGAGSASWTFCPSKIHPNSVVYSFGVGEDITFEQALIRRYGVTVHAFDPTPRSIAWINQQDARNINFHPYGLAALDGMASFSPPASEHWVSHSMLDSKSEKSIELPVRRLSTIMAELGHESIDLLKMDIEGAEYEVLRNILDEEIGIVQILVEFHHWCSYATVEMTRAAIEALNSAGYKIFTISDSGQEYGLIKLEGNGRRR